MKLSEYLPLRGIKKRDSALLHYHMGSRHPDPTVQPVFSKMRPSLIEELEARGYDITTLRFSIMKKQADGEGKA